MVRRLATRWADTAARAVLERWGKWILITPHDLDRADVWFAKYGGWTVLLGRCVPVIRSFVSLPAGIGEMKRVPFAVLSAIGSAIWIAILVALGYAAGDNWNHVSKDIHHAQLPVIIVVVLVILAAFAHRFYKVRRLSS